MSGIFKINNSNNIRNDIATIAISPVRTFISNSGININSTGSIISVVSGVLTHYDVSKINANNTINYTQVNVKTSGTGNKISVPKGFIDIGNVQDKYHNRFKGQPPSGGV